MRSSMLREGELLAAVNPNSSFERVNLVIGVLGILLTIVGFWIAIVQIRKTRTAAEAARDAAAHGTNRIRYNQLIILVPQLQNLEGEMDAVVRQNDLFAAERVLVRWRQVATQTSGILREMGAEHEELTQQIEKCCGAARAAKAKLVTSGAASTSKTVGTVTSAARKELSAVTDRLTSLMGRLATETDGGEVK